MLYLRSELLNKSKAEKPKTKAGAGKAVDTGSKESGRGSQRGGKYVARVQVGYEKDGSPKYRYFKTNEEYETYMSARGESKEAKKLESKVKREHRESTDKQTGRVVHQPASRELPSGLLSTKKSLSLFVRTT